MTTIRLDARAPSPPTRETLARRILRDARYPGRACHPVVCVWCPWEIRTGDDVMDVRRCGTIHVACYAAALRYLDSATYPLADPRGVYPPTAPRELFRAPTRVRDVMDAIDRGEVTR